MRAAAAIVAVARAGHRRKIARGKADEKAEAGFYDVAGERDFLFILRKENSSQRCKKHERQNQQHDDWQPNFEVWKIHRRGVKILCCALLANCASRLLGHGFLRLMKQLFLQLGKRKAKRNDANDDQRAKPSRDFFDALDGRSLRKLFQRHFVFRADLHR